MLQPILMATSAGVENTMPMALRFDSAKTHNVDHGQFWLKDQTYTSFYWDAFVRPTEANGTGYLISAGYGSQHDLLLGFSSGTTHASVTGNIWNGSGAETFGSAQIIPLGDWVHIAAVWDLTNLIVYINGVAEGYTPYAAANRSTAFDYNGSLFVGGSDHSNFSLDLKWVRGFEGVVPFATNSLQGYRPERYPKTYYYSAGVAYKADFLADYSYPCETIPDISGGFGTQLQHPGRREVGANIGAFMSASAGITNSYPDSLLPQWVAANVVGPTVGTSTIPPTAVIYDDFNRDSSPFWADPITLGSTEGGTGGVQVWAGANYGISYGRVFNYASGYGDNALVETTITDMDVRYTRTNDIWCFLRFQDTSNYMIAKLTGTNLQVLKVVGGASTELINTTVTGGDLEPNIKFTVVGDTVTAFYNGVQKATATSSPLPTGTKAGFVLNSAALAKLDTFEVYAG